MAVDKLVDSTQLDSDLTSVANAIRTKGGTSGQLAFPSGFVTAIGNIPTGGGGSIGMFSEYDYVDADTSDAALLTVQNPLGKVPKLVTIEAQSTPASGKIKHGLLTPAGGYCITTDTATSSLGIMYPTDELVTSLKTFVISASELNVRRYSAIENWDTTITYRVGFYA